MGDEKEELLALLDEQTAIATRTRMNADYVPGMVTVLHGDELEARGARTVWEALAQVPGMEPAIEQTGRRKILVRGLGNTWASGNVKILLNDVSMNSAELGLADPVFNIPIEQVDRIEVIRGPGSAVYGEYAYMGVINVITRADEGRIFAFGGEFNTRGAGVMAVLTNQDSPVKASLNVAGWRTSGADVTTGPDALYYYGMGNISNAPGPANEELEAGTAVFKLDYERFSLLAQWSQDGIGDHFGINFVLPPDPDHIVERWRHRTIEMRQELPLAQTLTAGIQLGWKDVTRERDDLFVVPDSPDLFLDSHYRETNLSAGVDLAYTGWAKHAVRLAATTSNVRVDENWIAFNPPNPGTAITIPEGTTRSIMAVTIQDEYRHSDLFTLTTGLRYDEYSDAGINYSPRIAGVWRLDERNIVKAQYAEAFRPPTLYETEYAAFFGRDALSAASIRTTELGYVFKGDRAESRVTSFYSELDDLVTFSLTSTPAFGNEGASAWGLELEQSWRPSSQFGFDGNVSYVDTRDSETGEPFPGSASWIANAGFVYKTGTFIGTLQAHYVNSYARDVADTRNASDGYSTVDVTGTFNHVFVRGMQLRLGVKNLLDAEIAYPSPVVAPATVTYPEDYPRPTRTWWTQLSYRF